MAMNMGVPDVQTGRISSGGVSGGIGGGAGQPASYGVLDAVQAKVQTAMEQFKQYMSMPGESEEADAGRHKVILGHLEDALTAIAQHKASWEGDNKTKTQNAGMNSALRMATGRKPGGTY